MADPTNLMSLAQELQEEIIGNLEWPDRVRLKVTCNHYNQLIPSLLGNKKQSYPDYYILEKAKQQERRWIQKSKLKPISSKNIIHKRNISGLSRKGDIEPVDCSSRVQAWVLNQFDPEPSQERVTAKYTEPQKAQGKKAPSYRDSALGTDITGPSKRTAKSFVFGRSEPQSGKLDSGKSNSGKSQSGKSRKSIWEISFWEVSKRQIR